MVMKDSRNRTSLSTTIDHVIKYAGPASPIAWNANTLSCPILMIWRYVNGENIRVTIEPIKRHKLHNRLRSRGEESCIETLINGTNRVAGGTYGIRISFTFYKVLGCSGERAQEMREFETYRDEKKVSEDELYLWTLSMLYVHLFANLLENHSISSEFE